MTVSYDGMFRPMRRHVEILLMMGCSETAVDVFTPLSALQSPDIALSSKVGVSRRSSLDVQVKAAVWRNPIALLVDANIKDRFFADRAVLASSK